MTMIWVIIMGTGEYSDRYERPVKAFLDKEMAQKIMGSLEKIQKSHSTKPFEGRKEREAACIKEYKELGFEADIYCDWELVEVELVK